MNQDLFFDAMDYIDDDMIEAVDVLRTKKKPSVNRTWIHWASAAACAVIVLGGVWASRQMYDSAENELTGNDNEAAPEMMPEYEGVTDGSDNGGTVYEQQTSIRLFESLEDGMKNADFILTCTVQEIGNSYAENSTDSIGIPGGQGELDYIRSIRTPILLAVDEVYYDSTGSLSDTLTVLEYQGTVGRYTLKNAFSMPEEGKTYLLFIAQAPDGETNIIIGQASVVLEEDSFTPLMNDWMYSEWATSEELLEAVRIAAEDKEAQNP